MSSTEQPSKWQSQITGEWYGIPSVFNNAGQHVGYNKVNRSSVFEDGRTTYYMDTDLQAVEPIQSRYEAQGFAFGVMDSDKDRIYMGPDFYGEGQPFGTLVDAHYYSPAWKADLKTMVHILPDGVTQVYSSLLYDGPRLDAVFNGMYLMATDYDTNDDTKVRIDAFVEGEKLLGKKPHVLPMKQSGTFHGTFKTYDANQELLGDTFVKMTYRPLNLLEAEVELFMEGMVNQRLRYKRTRHGNSHSYNGPDVFGNAFGYGRALYTSYHLKGSAECIRGREFIIDANNSQSVVWQLYKSQKLETMLYGVLKWEESDDTLVATYD